MSKFLKAIVNIVLLVAILSAGALLIPPLLGVTTKVSDGTGNTNLSRGSVTYATSMQAPELETGDKILQDDSNGSYVYTVTAIAADTSTYTLTDDVSGDTQEQQLSGGVQKVALTVPVIGMLSLTLQSREGIIILGLCVAFLIILFILSEVWRKDDDEDEDSEDEEEEAEETDEEEKEEQPLTRKEKRRLKKEARRKAREAEEDEDDDDVAEDDAETEEISEDEQEENSGDDETENSDSADSQEPESDDEMTIPPLEEEPEESTPVDPDRLKTVAPEEHSETLEEEISEELLETMDGTSQEENQDLDEELERSLADAVGALLRGDDVSREEDSSGPVDGSAAAEVPEESEETVVSETSEETEEIPDTEDNTEDTEEEPELQETEDETPAEEETEETEPEIDPEAPVELAMPVLTAEELLKKAEEAGDHPKVIEDKETGVTILDYSDIV